MNSKCLHGTTLALILAMCACSNGRGSLTDPSALPGETPPPSPPPSQPEPPPPPQAAAVGYWIGTFEPERGRDLGARALVTSAGDMHLIVSDRRDASSSPEFLVYGNVCCGASIEAELQSTRYLASSAEDARFRATVANDAMSGEVRIRGDDYRFTLTRTARPTAPLTASDLAGTYTLTRTIFLGAGTTYTITLDPSGELNGSHTNGCVYRGTAAIADPAYHLVKLDVQLSNCPISLTVGGSTNGSYTGLGVLESDGRTFLHSLIGPTWLGQQPTMR